MQSALTASSMLVAQMPRFPKSESDIAALARRIISGLATAAEDFPNPPVPPDEFARRHHRPLARRRAGRPGTPPLAMVGPAFVWCAEYIGSGEVILATRTGAIFGSAVLWAVVWGIFLKSCL